jgi:hypothetical protein
MRLATGWVAMGLLATGLGMPQAASALSLADLVAGSTVSSLDGGLTFDDFTISKAGKKTDVGAIEVTSIEDGFALEFSGTAKSKITFDYTVTANGGREILSGTLALDGPIKSKASAALESGGLDLATLAVKGGQSSSSALGSLVGLEVNESLDVKKGDASLEHSFALTAPAAPAQIPGVPEPATLLLLAPAAALLACRTRRQA